MDDTEDTEPDTTPDTEPDAKPTDDNTPNPESETQDNGEPEDAGDDKYADMANRLSALEATVAELSKTVAELSKTIEAMRDVAADHVLNDGPDGDTTPESAEMTDDDYNGTYSTFDDLFED
nr:MAG: hypothetical protein [Bacteriophage sp.]